MKQLKDIHYEDYQSLKQWVRSRTNNVYNRVTMVEFVEKRYLQLDKSGEFNISFHLPEDYDEKFFGRISGTFFRKNGTKAIRVEIITGEPFPILMSFDEIKRTEDIISQIDSEINEIVVRIPEQLEGDLYLEIKCILVKYNGSK